MLTSLDAPLAALLGLVQGLTEFLPVSSSGHIALGAKFFGLRDAPIALSVLLHAGTFLATVVVFRDDLGKLARDTLQARRAEEPFFETESGRLLATIVAATIPTALIGLALKGLVESESGNVNLVAACLALSAVVVVATRFGRGDAELPSVPAAVAVGVVQGIAVLPGLTRSGSTIAAAMLLGLGGAPAFRFSFLISLPAIAGAMLLELRHPEAWTGLGAAGLLGFVVSAVSGYVCLLLLRGLVHRGNLWVFALYLVPVSIALVVW